jgi:hypothetical protein
MIPAPAGYLDAATRTHAPVWRVSMGTPSGLEVLPILGGTITKDTATAGRCRATITVPTQPVAQPIDQAMIPTGQRLLFEYTIQHFNQWVVIADLDVIRSRIVRPDSMWEVEAVDRGARVGLDDTARGGWVPQTTGTIAAAIQYIVNRTFPGTTFSISGPALTQAVPPDSKTFGDPWELALRMAEAAGSELFFRAHDRVCVVRPKPDMGVPVDTLAAGQSVTAVDLDHEAGYNTVGLRYLNQAGDVLRTGIWKDTRTDSPVSVQRLGTHVVLAEDKQVDTPPAQADADAAAAAIGRRAGGRSRSPSIRHVARPWLEPGDTVYVAYAGGPTEAQLIDSVDIPLDNSNIQVTALRTHAYQMGVPA